MAVLFWVAQSRVIVLALTAERVTVKVAEGGVPSVTLALLIETVGGASLSLIVAIPKPSAAKTRRTRRRPACR